jgi:hypothetical protein
MDALLPGEGTQCPEGVSDAYRKGYEGGTEWVRPRVHQAA